MLATGFVVLLLSTLFQGSFGICFKKYQPFSWEAFWALFSIIGVLLMPHVWAAIAIGPEYMGYLLSTSPSDLFFGALAGFFWGISSIWYSRAIDYIGVSLVTGINLGLSNLLGSLVPMAILGTWPSPSVLALILVGQAVLMVGVVVLSKAGFMKRSVTEEASGHASEDAGTKKSSLFMVGFVMALASGAGSAALNIGSSATTAPVAVATGAGVPAIWATLLQWCVVMFGGFIANFCYALYKLIKNKTFSDYTKPGCGKAYGKVLLTAFVWFAALGIYGFATSLLGELGPVIGWIMFNGLALIIANLWGFRDGEWRGFDKARNVALVGNAIIIIALVILGISNGM
ncbi:L-rhamnose/proton symporter RhaT [Olsenella phocaeensis]|uniref:L-rhamnose/proton symporter RhaT n=1 Tax=Olsenella phocaeensis TaxID=1852385 RepID=UPI0009313256|nr:L-rhamnose/proton symporter RhaT [Olsenella phocaeensis]